MRIKILYLLIVAFWLTMMGSLVWQRMIPARLEAQRTLMEPEILAMQWRDVYEFAWVRREGRTFGASAFAVHRRSTDFVDQDPSRAAYVVFHNVDVRLPVLFTGARLSSRMTLGLDDAFRLSRFAARIDAASLQVEAEGVVDGTTLYTRVRPAGGDFMYTRHELAAPLSLVSTIRPLVVRHFDLEAGSTHEVQVLSPLSADVATVRVEVAGREKIALEGEEVEAWRVDSSYGDVVRSAWVNDEGEMLRSELVQGFVLERASRDELMGEHPDVVRLRPLPELDVREFVEGARRSSAAAGDAPLIDAGALEAMLGALLGGA